MLAHKANLVLATLPTGTGAKNWILQVAGNLLVAGVVIGLLIGFARQSIGKVIGVIILGGFCAWIVNSPDSFIGVIRSIGELFGQ